MSIHANDVRMPLARREDCAVSLCEQGMVHGLVGGLTAHVSRSAIERICTALHSATQRLATDEEPPCGRLFIWAHRPVACERLQSC